jgi:hypothetical protein
MTRLTGRPDEDARLAYVTCKILREPPSVLRTRNHVQDVASYVVPPTGAGDSLHRADGIYTVGLKRDCLWCEINKVHARTGGRRTVRCS